jgi:aminoglycoside phosphotransferase (APT) family kinase protein
MHDLESDRARSAPFDAAEAVRSGEELPLATLAPFLFTELPHLRNAFDDEITVAQFARGYSNLTYLIRIGEHELVLRRPPLGANIATAHDMGREVQVLTGLAKVYAHVPRVLLYCQDPKLIGAPFYLMERIQGVVLRADDPHRPTLAPESMARLATNVIDNLAAIHALDYTAAGLADLGKPAGYVARQVQGWTRRYHAAQTDSLPDLEKAMNWLAAHQPSESGAALIHNDYKYDNLILDPNDLTRLVAVLDWEMCTLGDPLMDLGTTLAYWMEPGDPPALVEMFGLTTLPGNPTRTAVVERYAKASGQQPFDPLFYYVYGLVKIGVILQQIYHRYRQGQSQDARFARLGGAVAACGLVAAEAMHKRRISGLF